MNSQQHFLHLANTLNNIYGQFGNVLQEPLQGTQVDKALEDEKKQKELEDQLNWKENFNTDEGIESEDEL